MRQKLSIIIPAFNEETTIRLILEKIRKVELLGGLEKEIIIVNDCSTDDTKAVIQRYMTEHPGLDIHYLEHQANRGKGASLHNGVHHASGNYLVIQDADLEYDPEEYNILLKPVLDGKADVVYGSRFMGGNPHRILFFWHSVGNKFLTFLSNAFTNLNLTDMETCYKLFRTPVIKNLDLREKGIRSDEVGISYYGRTYDEGKKINWKDGFRAIYCILKYNIFPG